MVGVLPGTRQKLSAPVLTPRGAAPTPGQADSDPGHWYWRADSSAPRYPVYSQTQGGPGDVGSPPASPVGFKRALLAGVAMTLASEIGDKTFFLAAILAMKLCVPPTASSAGSSLPFSLPSSLPFSLPLWVCPAASSCGSGAFALTPSCGHATARDCTSGSGPGARWPS